MPHDRHWQSTDFALYHHRHAERNVIARNSSFTYNGHAVDTRQVARALGVRYAFEGSVRRDGGRMHHRVGTVTLVADG
jgi:TolB-like protein